MTTAITREGAGSILRHPGKAGAMAELRRRAASAEDGILCPSCGSPNHAVIDSRHTEGRVRRRRRCECGATFYTQEVLMAGEPDFEMARLIDSLSPERRHIVKALLRELGAKEEA